MNSQASVEESTKTRHFSQAHFFQRTNHVYWYLSGKDSFLIAIRQFLSFGLRLALPWLGRGSFPETVAAQNKNFILHFE